MTGPDGLRDRAAFDAAFPDEEACGRSFVAWRWPDGVRCPTCGHERAYRLTGVERWQCAAPSCRAQWSPTSGTLLDRSKLPLRTWFLAAWLLVTEPRGISAAALARELKTGYKNAALLFHRLRYAAGMTERDRLHGTVELLTRTLNSGVRRSRRSPDQPRPRVLIAVERRGNHSGRCRLAVLPGGRAATDITAVRRMVEPGATLVGGSKAVRTLLVAADYEVAEPPARRDEMAVPFAEALMDELETLLAATFHGVGAAQLGRYVDEFSFRRAHRGDPAAAVAALLGAAAHLPPAPRARARDAAVVAPVPGIRAPVRGR